MKRLKEYVNLVFGLYLKHLPNHSDSPTYSRFDHSVIVTSFTKYLMTYNSDIVYSDSTLKLILFSSCIHDIQHPALSHLETYYPQLQQNKRISILNQPEMVQYIKNMKWNVDQFEIQMGSLINILKSTMAHINH